MPPAHAAVSKTTFKPDYFCSMADETDAWDKASTIGTMVAAFLAFIALAGVVGPILVWRASRTEKHKAIDLLEKGEAQNGGFITDGLRVSPTIRLFRRVRVPMLKKGPNLPGMTLSWKDDSTSVHQSSASWVQLSVALSCYGVCTDIGPFLSISADKTWLPVHKNWIMILGLMGRFSKRPDEGRLPIPLKGRLKSVQPLPGRAFGRQRQNSLYGRRNLLNLDWMGTKNYERPKSITDEGGDIFHAIHGNFGTLWLPDVSMRADNHKVYYTHHTSDERGELGQEPFPLISLFWLAVGCIPAENGDVYCLDNVDDIEDDNNSDSDSYENATSSVHRNRRRSTMTAITRAHFDTGDSDRHKVPQRRRASEFVIPSSNNQRGRAQRPARTSRRRAVRAYHFSPVNKRNEMLSELADAIEHPSQRGAVNSLEEINLPENVANDLEETSGATYQPALSLWTRLGSSDTRLGATSPQLDFIDRGNGQRLAQVLLDLKLSPEGYLQGSSKRSLCLQMLCNAAQVLPHLISRVIGGIEKLNVPTDITTRLSDLLNDLLDKCLSFKPDRAYFRTVFDLDTVLDSLVDPNPKVTTAVGVLMITSAEFRDIVARLARMIPEASDKLLTLECGPVTMLCIPSLLGVVQKFPVDFGVLYPGETIAVEAIQLSLSRLMFAALKACLRSVFLETCLESTPLFEAFIDMNDEIQVG
ncbi:hypothetical protein BJ166DRAFT_30422 [Pestalotiopsis sp. NC0098]|nr:hypothetical protein BJ166DRAFT_30422 [Pestalotiopsis sp. NC0098]